MLRRNKGFLNEDHVDHQWNSKRWIMQDMDSLGPIWVSSWCLISEHQIDRYTIWFSWNRILQEPDFGFCCVEFCRFDYGFYDYSCSIRVCKIPEGLLDSCLSSVHFARRKTYQSKCNVVIWLKNIMIRYICRWNS